MTINEPGYFVERDGGVIVALYAREQLGRAEEWLDADNAELIAFVDSLNGTP
jgi:hypothetical protein